MRLFYEQNEWEPQVLHLSDDTGTDGDGGDGGDVARRQRRASYFYDCCYCEKAKGAWRRSVFDVDRGTEAAILGKQRCRNARRDRASIVSNGEAWPGIES